MVWSAPSTGSEIIINRLEVIFKRENTASNIRIKFDGWFQTNKKVYWLKDCTIDETGHVRLNSGYTAPIDYLVEDEAKEFLTYMKSDFYNGLGDSQKSAIFEDG